jgi:hypothetical protein
MFSCIAPPFSRILRLTGHYRGTNRRPTTWGSFDLQPTTNLLHAFTHPDQAVMPFGASRVGLFEADTVVCNLQLEDALVEFD